MKVIEGHITSPFGGRQDPINGNKTTHQGIDIAAPRGSSVRAAANGVVSSIYNHPTGGLTLILRSECGLIRFGMCHLDEVLLDEGCKVRKGEVVALSGNSGRSTGAHLHFSVKTGGRWSGEVYIGGKFVDGTKYLEL
ncbi:MAG: M23 family metallopeptidase [Rikenellaceae bacterium]